MRDKSHKKTKNKQQNQIKNSHQRENHTAK